METTVNERIAQIIFQCGYKSKRSFAEKIGVAQTSLNDILRGAEQNIQHYIKFWKLNRSFPPNGYSVEKEKCL
ncbi:hypothetical protein DW837_01045 [Phocaeicola vulgatus]|nr:hypothetical protein DW837_01045 [Phocaeicola vulgatus]